MPGRSSQSKLLQYLGMLVAIVAVVGAVAFDRSFQRGSGGDLLPFAIGALAFAFALGYTIYSRVQR